MKCFYHKSDFDGQCSAAIIKLAYPECELVGVDYSDEPDYGTVVDGETIFIVDFSFPRVDMLHLNTNTDLIWIDHHKSAIDSMFDMNIKGLRQIGVGACELTWHYLAASRGITEDTPKAIKLLSRYDVWDHKDPEVLWFQYGLRLAKDTGPHSPIWSVLFEDQSIAVAGTISDGKKILKYETIQNALVAKSMSYTLEFEGLRALVINRPFSNSKVLDSVYDPAKHDIMIVAGFKNDEFKYTVYSNKPEIDVSKIATKFGGGGHAGAAGFYSTKKLV